MSIADDIYRLEHCAEGLGVLRMFTFMREQQHGGPLVAHADRHTMMQFCANLTDDLVGARRVLRHLREALLSVKGNQRMALWAVSCPGWWLRDVLVVAESAWQAFDLTMENRYRPYDYRPWVQRLRWLHEGSRQRAGEPTRKTLITHGFQPSKVSKGDWRHRSFGTYSLWKEPRSHKGAHDECL